MKTTSKYAICLGLFILSTFLIGCSQSNQKDGIATTDLNTVVIQNKLSNGNPASVKDFSKSFEGNINNDYPIIMTLNKSGNELYGTYLYKKVGQSIKISGKVDANANFTLDEFDNNGNQTGMFVGTNLNENNISGNWSKPDKSKIMPFTLTATNSLEDNFVRAPDKIISGEWKWVNNSDQLTFNLKIKQIGRNISGSYCAIADYGNRVDCDENGKIAIMGTINGQIANLNFTDYYSGATGKANITWINENKLLWEITYIQEGDYYLPKSAIMVH
jgi:hypothetical protein